MTKNQAIQTVQAFLDKSSTHRWKEIQAAIDTLKSSSVEQATQEEPRWSAVQDLTDREIVETWVDMSSPLNRPEFERHVSFIQSKLKQRYL